jgi:hypothetical protein
VDCHPTDFPAVRLTQIYADGRTVKCDNPVTDSLSIEAVLYCLREFMETANELDYDTGDERFNNFCRMLQGAAKDDWDILIIQNIPARIPVLFLAALEEWKAKLIMTSAHQTMVDYLETITKPRNMAVEVFVNHIKFMVAKTWTYRFHGLTHQRSTTQS